MQGKSCVNVSEHYERIPKQTNEAFEGFAYNYLMPLLVISMQSVEGFNGIYEDDVKVHILNIMKKMLSYSNNGIILLPTSS